MKMNTDVAKGKEGPHGRKIGQPMISASVARGPILEKLLIAQDRELVSTPGKNSWGLNDWLHD